MAKIRKNTLVVMLSVLCWLFMLTGTGLGTGKDFNGDGKDEIATLYDYPQNCAAIWLAKPSASGFSQTPYWASPFGGWDASKSRLFAGPFDDNPAYDDIAILQSYPNASAALWVFSSTGAGFAPQPLWASPLGGFDVSRTKTAAGDFDGDGQSEILALMEFPNSNAAIYLFDNPGTGWTATPVWASPNGTFDCAVAQISAGDFDNDGQDELAVLKAYPQTCAAVWIFKKSPSSYLYSATAWWASGYGSWDVIKSKMVAGNFDNSGGDDLAIMYDYPNRCAAVWQFASNGSSFLAFPAWASLYAAWNASLSKLTTGDTDGSGPDELYILQEYPNTCAALWQYNFSGDSYSRTPVWASAQGAWNVKKCRLANGNTYAPTESYHGNRAIIGYSILGRPISIIRIGNGSRRYLFIGAIHGDEPQGGRVLERFAIYLSNHPEAVPADAEVWIVPYANPDGVAFGARWNIRGVNLNRNFGTSDWGLYDVTSQPALELLGLTPMKDMSAIVTGTPYTYNFPGPAPFSEPETASITGLFSGTIFRAVISMHDSESRVYWGEAGADLAFLFGSRAGLPVVGALSISGDMTRWAGQAYGTPAITVEMTGDQVNSDPDAVFGAYLPALMATLYY